MYLSGGLSGSAGRRNLIVGSALFAIGGIAWYGYQQQQKDLLKQAEQERAKAARADDDGARQEAMGKAIAMEAQAAQLQKTIDQLKAQAAQGNGTVGAPTPARSGGSYLSMPSMSSIPSWVWLAGIGAIGMIAFKKMK